MVHKYDTYFRRVAVDHCELLNHEELIWYTNMTVGPTIRDFNMSVKIIVSSISHHYYYYNIKNFAFNQNKFILENEIL